MDADEHRRVRRISHFRSIISEIVIRQHNGPTASEKYSTAAPHLGSRRTTSKAADPRSHSLARTQRAIIYFHRGPERDRLPSQQ